jgi:hypothetical protein
VAARRSNGMNGRDKRRKLKRRQEPNRIIRSQTPNPAGVQVQQKASEPVHGKYCRVRSAKISVAVCTVQSTRTPDLCRGCE